MAFWNKKKKTEARSSFTFQGVQYPFSTGYAGIMPDTSTMAAGRPQVAGDLKTVVAAAQPHSVMSAAVLVRALLMSELRFQWADTETHDRYHNKSLALFENPGGVSMNLRRLLMQMSQQADYTGNGVLYHNERKGHLRMLPVGNCKQIIHSDATAADVDEIQRLPASQQKEALEGALDAEVIGWSYKPHPKADPQFILPEHIAHWAPEPHPLSPFLGASWITSAITELAGDLQADRGVDQYFEHGMTPRLMHIMHEDTTPAEAQEWKMLTEDEHAGVMNGAKNLYAGGVKDIRVVGTTLKDLGLKEYRGELETRIAVRSRIPATILGISEGNQGSALNGSTYGQTRRMLADGFFTPQAAGLCSALEQIVKPPKPSTKHPRGAYLTYDKTQVMFLQEDEKDKADIFGIQSRSVRALTDGGYTPESIVDAVQAADVRKLKHSGLTSVQLLPPGAERNAEPRAFPMSNMNDARTVAGLIEAGWTVAELPPEKGASDA